MDRAWPGGVPDGEVALRARLSENMRELVARRLDVVTRFAGERVGDRPTAASAAAEAGVSVARLYSIAAAWRRTRTIAALGARAGEDEERAHARAHAPDVEADISARIRDLLLTEPDAGVTAVTRRIVDAGVRPLPPSSMRRLWEAARRTLPPGPFGAMLVFDSVGMDAVLDGERMRLYAVVDVGSGVIVGWADATARSGTLGLVEAAHHAVDVMHDLDLSVLNGSDAPPAVELRLQADAAGGELLRDALRGSADVLPGIGGTLGRAIIDQLGDRIGGVWVGLGERSDGLSYRYGRRARFPEYTGELGSRVDEAIAAHNAGRIAAAAAAAAGGGATDGDVAARRVKDLLAIVAGFDGAVRSVPSYKEPGVP